MTARNKNRQLRAFALFVLASMLIGCTQSGAGNLLNSATPAPTVALAPTLEAPLQTRFTSLLRGYSMYDIGPTSLDTSTVTIFAKTADITHYIASGFSRKNVISAVDELTNAIQAVDFDTHIAVLIFYAGEDIETLDIAVQSVQHSQQVVQLDLALIPPDPNITYPAVNLFGYHLITIERGALEPLPGTVWRVVALDGRLLAETRYP